MIPSAHQRKKLHLPAVGFILASIILAILLGLISWRNLDREERLMEKFLLEEGLTLIRAFEAGARTSMMMNWADNSLTTLVRETARADSIAYVVVTDASGRPLTAAGAILDRRDVFPAGQVLAQSRPRIRRTIDEAGQTVFEVATEFKQVVSEGSGGDDMMGRWQRWCGMDCASSEQVGRRAVFVGLYTGEFDAARNEDIRQSLLMGGLLLLLGSTGFYFLFLSQQNRVAKATLANMEL